MGNRSWFMLYLSRIQSAGRVSVRRPRQGRSRAVSAIQGAHATPRLFASFWRRRATSRGGDASHQETALNGVLSLVPADRLGGRRRYSRPTVFPADCGAESACQVQVPRSVGGFALVTMSRRRREHEAAQCSIEKRGTLPSDIATMRDGELHKIHAVRVPFRALYQVHTASQGITGDETPIPSARGNPLPPGTRQLSTTGGLLPCAAVSGRDRKGPEIAI